MSGSAPRFVVCGPPGSGKTAWVAQHAAEGSLVWDLDQVAGVLAYQGREIPGHMKGRLPWRVAKALLAMRDGLLDWLSRTSLCWTPVYVIVTSRAEAERFARQIGAEVVDLTGAQPKRVLRAPAAAAFARASALEPAEPRGRP